MTSLCTRRTLLKLVSTSIPLEFLLRPLPIHALDACSGTAQTSLPESFPSQPPELVREVVTVSHLDLRRVQQLVDSRPALARAAWDWGFGDWETPIGAASHMGNHQIAEYLISKGAQPSLFSAAMMGQLDVVKAFVAAHPDAQRIRGPHSITLLAHARMGGDRAREVFQFLQSLKDADQAPPSPLVADQAAAIVGTYVFETSGTQQVDVDDNVRAYADSKMYSYAPQLNWTRKGTMARPLFHLGDQTFYPAGAPDIRIRFASDGSDTIMTVHDSCLVLSARRRKPTNTSG